MKYIKPETTVVKADGMVLLSGSLIEEGKLEPGTGKGKDNGDGNIVMAKRHPCGFDDSLDTGWNTDDDDIW